MNYKSFRITRWIVFVPNYNVSLAEVIDHPPLRHLPARFHGRHALLAFFLLHDILYNSILFHLPSVRRRREHAT